MSYLSEEEIQFKMLLGMPIFIEGIGDFEAPLLKDIVEITERRFNELTSTLLFGKESVQNAAALQDVDDYSLFRLLLLFNPAFQKNYFEGIQFYIHETPQIDAETGDVYFHQLTEATMLTEEKFNYIKKLVKIANNISLQEKKDEIKPGNERAKKFMEELEKKKAALRSAKKETMNLQSIVSAVAWKSQRFDFLSSLTIYQLYDGFKRLTYIDNYDKTMTAVFSGTIDSTKINREELNWANIIQDK